MKIKLIKDHMLGKAGDVVDTEQGRARYLIRCGVAVEHVEVKDEKPPVEKKAPAKKKSAPKKKKDAEG